MQNALSVGACFSMRRAKLGALLLLVGAMTTTAMIGLYLSGVREIDSYASIGCFTVFAVAYCVGERHPAKAPKTTRMPKRTSSAR